MREWLMQFAAPPAGDAMSIRRIRINTSVWESPTPLADLVVPAGHKIIIEVGHTGSIEVFRETI